MNNEEIRKQFLDKYEFEQRTAQFTKEQIMMIENQAELFGCSFEEAVSLVVESYFTQQLIKSQSLKN